jgi:hypothetical protein
VCSASIAIDTPRAMEMRLRRRYHSLAGVHIQPKTEHRLDLLSRLSVEVEAPGRREGQRRGSSNRGRQGSTNYMSVTALVVGGSQV